MRDVESLLREMIRSEAEQIIQEKAAQQAVNHESTELERQLSEIRSKDFLRLKEAALLLNCSESLLRKQVTLAKRGKIQNPIPYSDRLGIVLFKRTDLLAWIEDSTPRPQLRVG